MHATVVGRPPKRLIAAPETLEDALGIGDWHLAARVDNLQLDAREYGMPYDSDSAVVFSMRHGVIQEIAQHQRYQIPLRAALESRLDPSYDRKFPGL